MRVTIATKASRTNASGLEMLIAEFVFGVVVEEVGEFVAVLTELLVVVLVLEEELVGEELADELALPLDDADVDEFDDATPDPPVKVKYAL